jgi:uncharacterized protein YhaN
VKINALEIDGYGVCSGLRVEGFCAGLSVLYGPNEAGKTTLLQFIRSMLYGFSPERRQYLPPVHGGSPGGTIDVSAAPGRFEIARHLQTDGPDGEQLVLTAADGTRQGEHLVKVLLANIDEAIFNNVFAVELRELQELATLSDTEAAELLYNLTAGLDRVSLVEVMRGLEDSRNLILDAGGKPSQLTQLWAQREKLRLEIDQLGSLTRQYSRLAAESAQNDGDLACLEEDKNQAQRRLRIVELALALRDRWSERKAIIDQMAALGSLPPAPPGAIERLDAINVRLKKHHRRVETIQARTEALAAEASALQINEPLRRQAARIEALQEQESWLAALKTQIQELDAEIAGLESELASLWMRLGFEDSELVDLQPTVAGRSLVALRLPARALRRCRAKLNHVKLQRQKTAHAAETLSCQIEAALSARQENDLVSAMDHWGNLVAQYRRRLQCDERLDQLSRHQSELDQQSRSLVEHQLLPVGVLVGLGAAFVLGMVLILAGLFMPASLTGSAGWTLALLGLAGSGAAVLAKFLLEKSHAARLDSCQKHLAMVQSQIQQAKTEREQLDAQLPRGGGPIVSRLEAAEKELAALEELVPLETRRAAAQQETTTAQQRVSEAEEEFKAARRGWRETLAGLRLPLKLSARQVRGLCKSRQHLSELQRRLSARREEIQRRRQEWDSLASRVAQAATEAGLALEGPDLIEHIKQLGAALAQQQSALSQREALRRRIRHLRLLRAKSEEAISRLKHRRRELFFEVGTQDEAEFRHRVLQHARAEVLRRDRDALTEEIAAALGDQCSEEALRKQLEDQPVKELEPGDAALRDRLEALEAQIRDRREKRGQLGAQLQALTDDRQLPLKQLELSVIERRMEEALDRWCVLAAACRIMERIRAAYERERQPETLQEASAYLKRLTQGRYHRVWTPLGQNVLRVDDAEGHCLPVGMLSRGTREQMFLSLRMALAACYARRGAVLPMVLDDVLVNFDADRAAAAAAVLCDFARAGHQLIVFTCHEHISKIFAALGVPISCLPTIQHGQRATISFKMPDELPEQEIKPSRRRSASRRKAAAKQATPGENIALPAEPLENEPPDRRAPTELEPPPIEMSEAEAHVILDISNTLSADCIAEDTYRLDHDQSLWEDEAEEDYPFNDLDDNHDAEAA